MAEAADDEAKANKEKLRRSITALERLFGSIGGFGLTIGVKTSMEAYSGDGGIYDFWHIRFPDLVVALVTLVPFFHGSVRHIEEVHLYSKAPPRPWSLFVDYTLLFIETIVLVYISLSIEYPARVLHLLAFLLAIDFCWSLFTRITLRAISEARRHLTRWVWLDVGMLLTLGAILTLASGSNNLSWVMAIAALSRSAVDYWLLWDFYFATGKK